MSHKIFLQEISYNHPFELFIVHVDSDKKEFVIISFILISMWVVKCDKSYPDRIVKYIFMCQMMID